MTMAHREVPSCGKPDHHIQHLSVQLLLYLSGLVGTFQFLVGVLLTAPSRPCLFVVLLQTQVLLDLLDSYRFE